jgi:hypothetical protein
MRNFAIGMIAVGMIFLAGAGYLLWGASQRLSFLTTDESTLSADSWWVSLPLANEAEAMCLVGVGAVIVAALFTCTGFIMLTIEKSRP